jgi:hypothetical protein
MDIRAIRKLAAELGATVEEDETAIYASASVGTLWQSEGGALLVAVFSGGRAYPQPAWKRDACADLHARMAPGLVPDPNRPRRRSR